VVLVDNPFSDRTGSKVRPCLVVQSDPLNARLDDTILVTITSRVRHVDQSTERLIDVTTPAGVQSGLLFDSAVQCHNILTVDSQFILRKVGSLPTDAMQQIDACLKDALGMA
jgi:mRNA interferase MazF